jgi:methylated-DNA-[protein]-cysteine S-methyltransferase
MTQELYYFIFDTAAGWVGVLGSTTGLLRVTFPGPDSEVKRFLGVNRDGWVWSPERFHSLKERFQAYFAGQKMDFPDVLDLTAATSFQRETWAATRLIPYGETRSYKWIAEHIKKPEAVRAVGQALGRNPLPVIIPCHRVLSSNGALGGFIGGLDMKRMLLRLENALKTR